MVCAPATSRFRYSRPPGVCSMTTKVTSGHTKKQRTQRIRFGAWSQIRLSVERLEDRLALSGFGPEDGAHVVAPWELDSGDVAVAIRPDDQAIVLVGNTRLNNAG